MKLRYQPYHDVKASGIKWMGEIPEHWETLQGHRLFGERKERTRPEDEQLTASQKYGVIPQAMFMRLEDQKVMQVYLNAEILKHVEPNDFVISMRSFQGGLEFCGHSGCVSSAYVGIYALKHVDPSFFKYLFKSSPYIQALQSTSNLVRDGQALRFQNFSMVRLPVVPKKEQKQIAAFLDYETAKIDALIEKQQQLIALLGEKRQAVISHAVTKGLNPDAPMRESGVEWLGEVPEHWNVVNLNVIAEIGNGSTPDRSTPRYWGSEGDYPWLNSSVVNQIEVHEADQFVTESALRECHLPRIVPPAVLVGITGQGKTRGMATILQMEATLNQHVTFIQPRDERVSVPFIHRFFQMAYDHIRFESEGAGSTKGAITCGQLEKLKTALPPPMEQDRIISHLGDFVARIDVLTCKAEEANEVLQERRTALISAAVTGKIDVRGWEPPSSDARLETEMEVA